MFYLKLIWVKLDKSKEGVAKIDVCHMIFLRILPILDKITLSFYICQQIVFDKKSCKEFQIGEILLWYLLQYTFILECKLVTDGDESQFKTDWTR